MYTKDVETALLAIIAWEEPRTSSCSLVQEEVTAHSKLEYLKCVLKVPTTMNSLLNQ